jgi:hypothetical protein
LGSDREDDTVIDKKTWFITGAGRGMGTGRRLRPFDAPKETTEPR